jgi:hypothetical protein
MAVLNDFPGHSSLEVQEDLSHPAGGDVWSDDETVATNCQNSRHLFHETATINEVRVCFCHARRALDDHPGPSFRIVLASPSLDIMNVAPISTSHANKL